jgi:hypothetical protein
MKTVKVLHLTEFSYCKFSFYSLKAFIALLAHRSRFSSGIATISYDQLSVIAGGGRHHIAHAITKIYDKDRLPSDPATTRPIEHGTEQTGTW